MARVFNVLFVCTANSARSLMAEAVLNQMGAEKFRAFSAGSQPSGEVHPLVLDLLERNRMNTEGLRSKSWAEFARPGAPVMDFVFTLRQGRGRSVSGLARRAHDRALGRGGPGGLRGDARRAAPGF